MVQRILVSVVLFICYVPLFLHQENLYRDKNYSLAPIMPAKLQAITFGYLRQVAAEIAFIRSAVFLGGVPSGTDPESYAAVLEHNYKEMTSLYPEFIDPYYYCQSYLAYIGPQYAELTIQVLQTGINALPDDIYLRFFQGFDFLYYLDEPLEAARVFKGAAELPDAPPWFLRVSALLSAEGGDIYAGLFGLRVISSTETDPVVKERYELEVIEFEKAVFVQNALKAYKKKYGSYPDDLQELVPEFLQTIPEMENNFKLIYEKPLLRLERQQ